MKFTKLAAAVTLGLALSAAHAATATKTFNVKIAITGTCDAAAFTGATVNDVDFGSHAAAATSLALQATNSPTNTLTVTCSKGTVVTVGLTPASATAGSSTGAGAMGNGTDTIAYQLKQPTAGGSPITYTAAYTTNWGDQVGTNTLSVTGQGMTTGIKLPVAATVAANALNVSAGNYTEQVTATLTY